MNMHSQLPETVPQYDARVLIGGQSVARIVLDLRLYTLCITKAGKLILTK
ncbi:MAG: hemin uptake protein HemP [Paracoccaceae bacterium]